MNFNIVLFEGTDTIKFGMSHDEVRAFMGKEPTLFKKGEFDLYMTENYAGICHVYYDDVGCVAFEFMSPSQAFYNNINLLGQRLKNVESLFSKLEGYGRISDTVSAFNGDFSVWGRFDNIESVYISRKGYFAEQETYYAKKYAEKYNF